MGTYIRPSIKKDFVCCHPTQIFQVGRLDNMHVVLFFYMIIVVVCCSFLKGGGTLNFYGWPFYTYLSLQ